MFRFGCARQELMPHGRRVVYQQGQHLHQALMGASGGKAKRICAMAETTMAELVYANSLYYGFAELEANRDALTIRYIAASSLNGEPASHSVVFESHIVRSV